MNTATHMKFTCPLCLSPFYGTDRAANEGSCHGPRCQFTWNRNEDWKYFQHVTYITFDSREEYERHKEEYNRLQPAVGTVAS